MQRQQGALAAATFLLLTAVPLIAQVPWPHEWAELTAHTRRVTGSFFESAVADIDGDGRTDLLLEGARHALLRNAGGMLYEDWTDRLPQPVSFSNRVLFFDADKDGDPDLLRLAGAYATSRQDRLYLNDGTGRFTDVTSTHMPRIDVGSVHGAAGDVDGDGDQDLAIATDQGIRLLIGDGTGRFTDATSTNMPATFQRTAELALVDIDNDRDLDMVMANTDQYRTVDVVFLNDGRGRFTDATATNFRNGLVRAYHLKVADFDGNGSPDLFLADDFNFGFAVNDGKGVFTGRQLGIAIWPSPADIEAIDIDADGDQDLIFLQGKDRRGTQVLRNDGNFAFTDISSQVTTFPLARTRLLVADLNDDKKDDLLYPNLGTRPEILLQDRPGTFVNVTTHQVPKGELTHTIAEVADLTGDGAPDLVTARGIHVNDGRGVFTASGQGAPALATAAGAVVADFDGDGDLDIFVVHLGAARPPAPSGRQNLLLLNDGRGNLTDITANNLPAANDSSARARAVDIDGDGDLDLLVANARTAFGTTPSGIVILRNIGRGVFQDATTMLPPQANDTRDVLPGDVDRDGRLDLVAVDADAVRIYLGTPAGFVLSTQTLAILPGALTAGDIADVDLDGDPDLLIGGTAGTQLYRNHLGTFAPVPASGFPPVGRQVRALRFAEVDGDPFVEALVSVETVTTEVLLFDNLGGVFRDATGRLGGNPFAFGFGVGDIDQDGDVDIVLPTNGGGLRVNLDLRRQLHSALPATVGGSYVADLYYRFGAASPGHAAVLAVGVRQVRVPIPGLGVLGVDPVVALPPRALPGLDGRESFAFPVPNNPQLKGQRALLQALMATDQGLVLSNAVEAAVR